MNRIKVKKELCMACKNCVLGCMAEHNEKGKSMFDLDLLDLSNESRNHISLDSKARPTPIICRHCDEPECVYACMSGAMTKDVESGIVSYDKKKCASCFMCVMSCPYGVLKADEIKKEVILKCDMCNGRDVARCVESCPTGCLYIDGGEA